MRRRVTRVIAVLIATMAVAGIGIALYYDERSSRSLGYEVGNAGTPDRVELAATVQQVDGVSGQLHVHLLVRVEGRLQDGDDLTPAEPLTVDTSSLTQGLLRFPAHERMSPADLTMSITDGVVQDYPFDAYRTSIGFAVAASDRPVPIVLTVDNLDGQFLPKAVNSGQARTGLSVVDLRISRSRGTLIFAWFMMLCMWALALVVAGAAWIIIGQRRGLPWPALGWMAATLFALVGFRNAAPGSPPSGSLLDYAAFWWAEAIIALSVIAIVTTGLRVERAQAD
ncbi:DUF4436 family protein [Solihabitans fulvus]|nr:DUF4436 family protein [Solihabitans fulvus]